MSKTILFLLSLVFFCGAIFHQISFAVENGPEKITLCDNGRVNRIQFDHWTHQEMTECGFCHHSVDDSGNRVNYSEEIETIKCANCHNSNLESKNFNSIKKVGHSLCRKCHQARGQKVSCPICHSLPNNS